jgi:hypothetical protein
MEKFKTDKSDEIKKRLKEEANYRILDMVCRTDDNQLKG